MELREKRTAPTVLTAKGVLGETVPNGPCPARRRWLNAATLGELAPARSASGERERSDLRGPTKFWRDLGNGITPLDGRRLADSHGKAGDGDSHGPSTADNLVSLSDRHSMSPKPRALYLNFVAMAVYFSANHGCVTSVIALASSFDATLGTRRDIRR